MESTKTLSIFFDVDTQNDFINSGGALAVPNAESLKPNLKMLTDYAQKKEIKILGSVDRHFGTEEYRQSEQELSKWSGPFPQHCMDGSEGQMKIDETNIENAAYISSKKQDDTSLRNILQAPQIIFEKQSYDVFYSSDNAGGNQNIDTVLKMLGVTEAVVYGVATDICVKAAVLGLREREIDVYIVTDAIAAVNVNPEDGENALTEMLNAEAKCLKTNEIISE